MSTVQRAPLATAELVSSNDGRVPQSTSTSDSPMDFCWCIQHWWVSHDKRNLSFDDRSALPSAVYLCKGKPKLSAKGERHQAADGSD